jgi:hypothetical protein
VAGPFGVNIPGVPAVTTPGAIAGGLNPPLPVSHVGVMGVKFKGAPGCTGGSRSMLAWNSARSRLKWVAVHECM